MTLLESNLNILQVANTALFKRVDELERIEAEARQLRLIHVKQGEAISTALERMHALLTLLTENLEKAEDRIADLEQR